MATAIEKGDECGEITGLRCTSMYTDIRELLGNDTLEMAEFANIRHKGRAERVATLNVSLPDAMRAWIDAQIEAGEYANASDYIRDLIRHDQRQRDALRLALIEGEKSGRSTRSVTDIARQTKRRLKRG